jgi:2-polyprenyl-6-methoxyphenol hydroxylase-like FAD-dependent oxidoreductase
MMAGWLLARAGVPVTVLEKHGDFLRDFRGDTIHPSTLELMHELGVLDDFLQVPHTEQDRLAFELLGERVQGPDLRLLPTRCKFVAFMPQWDFLRFVEQQARRYPTFDLRMNTEGVDLLRDGDRVVGVRTSRGDVQCDLVIAADGRHSVIRDRSGLPLRELSVPIDVLWMRIPRKPSDGQQLFGSALADQFLVMIERGDYWQCAYLIRKGGLEELKQRGLPAFRARLAQVAPMVGDRLDALTWDDIKLLSVQVDRLARWWQPGLLCIGDAAHAMSPVGGVGINLAIQDAVAAANALWQPLQDGRVPEAVLASVQRRRWLPTVVTQRGQILLHDYLIRPILDGHGERNIRALRYLLTRVPIVRRFMAYAIGIGLRPEHVHTPDQTSGARRSSTSRSVSPPAAPAP